MDTKKEVARIMREVADVQNQDHAMQDRALSGAGMKVPHHFNKSGVTGSPARARAEHAQRDKNLSTVPTPKKP